MVILEVVRRQVLDESTLVTNDLTDCPGEGLVIGAQLDGLAIDADLAAQRVEPTRYAETLLSWARANTMVPANSIAPSRQ